MTFLQIYLIIGGVILGVMTLLWLLSLTLKNSSIVDIFWGLGFVTGWGVYDLGNALNSSYPSPQLGQR